MSLPLRRLAWALLGALLLAGCAHYPAGLTKSEWEALTPGQQERYRRLERQDNAKFEQYSAERRREAGGTVGDVENRNNRSRD